MPPGLALIAVPFLIGVVTAALQIRALADTGQKIVVEGVTAARASQELFSQISSLERTARLYDVLNDPNLLELYRRQDARLSATRIQLEHHDQSLTARKTLGELGELQRNIGLSVMSMQAGKGTSNATGMSRRFTELGALADKVAAQSNAQIDTEVAALDRKSTRLNSSHQIISYAVFCLKKKKTKETYKNTSTISDSRRQVMRKE